MSYSFTTIMETPTLSYPFNEEINIPLNKQLEWNTVDGADLYLIEISDTYTFEHQNVIMDSSHTTYFPLQKLDNEKYYYWKVRAARTTDSSEWSEVYKFRTELVIPRPLYPIDKSENIEVNPIFKWKEHPNQVNYQIQVSKSSDFNNIIIDSTIDVPYYSIRNLKTNTFFYWRVKSIDGEYQSSWSPTFMFQTGDNFIVQEPILILPKHNTISDFPIKFMWSPSYEAIKYRIEISANSNFTEIVKNVETINPEFIFETDNPKEYYYWRVKAFTTYDSSKWSNAWLVKPYNPYQKVYLVSPKNGELQVRTKDTLKWQPIIGADYYILDIAMDKEFSDLVVDHLKVQTNSYIFTNFTKGKQYYWRVKCSIKDRENVWSNVWSFTIETNYSISSPKNIFPLNNNVGFFVDGKFEWETVPDARYYRLAISKDTLFDDIVISIITSDNYYTLQHKLDYSEKYYWRVAALSELANSKWSNSYNFTTELEAPKFIKPQSMETNLPLITEFSWNEVKDFTYFTLHISKYEDFKYLDYNINNILNNKIQLKLETDQTYFARVKSNNYENESRWSKTIIFSTGDNINSITDFSTNEIMFYPNPVKSILNIVDIHNAKNIQIFDIEGNTIEIEVLDNQINLENLVTGTYFLKIGNRIYKLIKE